MFLCDTATLMILLITTGHKKSHLVVDDDSVTEHESRFWLARCCTCFTQLLPHVDDWVRIQRRSGFQHVRVSQICPENGPQLFDGRAAEYECWRDSWLLNELMHSLFSTQTKAISSSLMRLMAKMWQGGRMGIWETWVCLLILNVNYLILHISGLIQMLWAIVF